MLAVIDRRWPTPKDSAVMEENPYRSPQTFNPAAATEPPLL
jgi:hypothetical protein